VQPRAGKHADWERNGDKRRRVSVHEGGHEGAVSEDVPEEVAVQGEGGAGGPQERRGAGRGHPDQQAGHGQPGLQDGWSRTRARGAQARGAREERAELEGAAERVQAQGHLAGRVP